MVAAYAVILLLATLAGSLQSAHAVQKSKEKTFGKVRDDKALVYFIRSPDWGRSVESLLYLFSDDKFLGLLSKNSYTFVQLDPGVHYLWHSAAVREKAYADLASTREFELKAGTETFMIMNYRVPPHVFFAVVGKEQGIALIKKARVHATPDEPDIAEANAMIEKRLVWLQEMKERIDVPDVVVRKVPDPARRQLLCDAHKIFVEQTRIAETARGSRLSDADDFEKTMRKRLKRFRYEAVTQRDQADLVLASTVDKVRTETHGRGYKHVRTVRVALLTLDDREVWSMEIDNSKVSVTSNLFNTWTQLARRIVVEMRDVCKPPKK